MTAPSAVTAHAAYVLRAICEAVRARTPAMVHAAYARLRVAYEAVAQAMTTPVMVHAAYVVRA